MEWLSSKRIQGVTADTKPTNVPVGTEFMNTETRVLSIFNGTSWDNVSGGGGGSSTLSGLTDVNFTTLTDNDVVSYDQASGKFINEQPGAVTVPDATTTSKGKVELATDGENAANVVVQGNDSRLSNSRTPTSHASTHLSNGSDAIAAATNTVRGTVLVANSGESDATKVTISNDSRLSDSRTPTAHKASHVAGGSDTFVKADKLNVSSRYIEDIADMASDNRRIWIDDGTANMKYWDDQAVPVKQQIEIQSNKGAASGYASLDSGTKVPVTQLPDATTSAKGVSQLATSAQTTAGLVVQASDTRLSDSRTPTAHAASHLSNGSDAIAAATTAVRGTVALASDGGTTAGTAVQANDSRLSNSRTPTAHEATHKAGGSDPFVKGDDLNASSRYLEDVADMASDAQRIWMDDGTENVKYWSDESTPVKHTIATAANALTFTNKLFNGLKVNSQSKTATYTATATDDFIPCAPAANMTVNLPAAASSTGKWYYIVKTNSNAFTVTIDPNSTETINGATTMVLSQQYQGAIAVCDGTGWYTNVVSFEKTGKAIASGNGSTTVFNIQHGLGVTPSYAFVDCSSHAIQRTWAVDGTNITITFTSAPSSGTNNVIVYWRAIP